MTDETITKIKLLREDLLAERVYFFNTACYVNFFKYKNNDYNLEVSETAKINLKLPSEPQQAMSFISEQVRAYHQLPFWKQAWWQITTPIRIYQRLYDIDTLYRIEVAALNDSQKLYEDSFIQPGFVDILFNTWRARLKKMIDVLPINFLPISPLFPSSPNGNQDSSAEKMQKLNDLQESETMTNPKLKALSDELAKGIGNYSVTRLVDLYEDFKFSSPSVDEARMHKLELKIQLLIHPDRNHGHIKEATEQFQRFQQIKDTKTTIEAYSYDTVIYQHIKRELDQLAQEMEEQYLNWERLQNQSKRQMQELKDEISMGHQELKDQMETRDLKNQMENLNLQTQMEMQELKNKMDNMFKLFLVSPVNPINPGLPTDDNQPPSATK
jgi:hypothetical protein